MHRHFFKAPQRAGTVQSVNIALGFVGVFALVLGVWEIRNLIRLPLVPETQLNENVSATNTLANASPDSPEVQTLRQKDTDGDGLSDYDELYIYHTSPYLKDTDSDGDNDGTEVKAGKDPLDKMPGRQGSGLASTQTNTSSTTSGGVASPSASDIRAFLKQQGASDTLLNKYDDATLLKLYGEVSTSTNTATQVTPSSNTNSLSTNTNSSTAPQITEAQRQAISKLSGAQLRQLLINSGVDAQTLSQFDDATILAIVKQSLGL